MLWTEQTEHSFDRQRLKNSLTQLVRRQINGAAPDMPWVRKTVKRGCFLTSSVWLEFKEIPIRCLTACITTRLFQKARWQPSAAFWIVNRQWRNGQLAGMTTTSLLPATNSLPSMRLLNNVEFCFSAKKLKIITGVMLMIWWAELFFEPRGIIFRFCCNWAKEYGIQRFQYWSVPHFQEKCRHWSLHPCQMQRIIWHCLIYQYQIWCL